MKPIEYLLQEELDADIIGGCLNPKLEKYNCNACDKIYKYPFEPFDRLCPQCRDAFETDYGWGKDEDELDPECEP